MLLKLWCTICNIFIFVGIWRFHFLRRSISNNCEPHSWLCAHLNVKKRKSTWNRSHFHKHIHFSNVIYKKKSTLPVWANFVQVSKLHRHHVKDSQEKILSFFVPTLFLQMRQEFAYRVVRVSHWRETQNFAKRVSLGGVNQNNWNLGLPSPVISFLKAEVKEGLQGRHGDWTSQHPVVSLTTPLSTFFQRLVGKR